jgi:hypothetical protein
MNISRLRARQKGFPIALLKPSVAHSVREKANVGTLWTFQGNSI